MEEEEEEIKVTKKKSEAPPPRRRPNKIVIPRRAPSVVIPGRQVIFTTADKTTCEECTCYLPKEEPFLRPKKLRPCQQTPLTLYELSALVVDQLKFPEAFGWSIQDVADWMDEVLGLHQYRESVLDNHINGLRLLMLEDPSHIAAIGINDFQHIQLITKAVRQLFSVEFVRFARSIGLPPRKPLTHCTWFKSRTGPSWGIRVNWTRCDILRWMKIIMPAPVYRDHWDLVWYHKPDFPKVMFARIKKPKSQVFIPHYKKVEEVCNEYQIPRKFRFQCGIPEEEQMIWMERRPDSPVKKERRKKEVRKIKMLIPPESRLVPKRISLTGLQGRDLVLARRKMPTPKFLT